MNHPDTIVKVEALCKRFILHNQGGATLDVLRDVSLTVQRGECVVLNGPSGTGKSTLLRCIYGNYHVDSGHILVRDAARVIDIATAKPREILAVRRHSLGYVSQFLRVIPRVSTIDVVAQPLRRAGVPDDEALDRAAAMLARLNVPERLWPLAPATFSGGEQQRVNIARGFISPCSAMLLDEPTSALDADNRELVVALIKQSVAVGTAMICIVHDRDIRERIATRLLDMAPPQAAA